MQHRLVLRSIAAVAAFSALWTALPAAAHISLDDADTHKSRYGGGHAFIKQGPCGVAGGTRGSNVYTYEPGQTITVRFKEYIPHPGYYRFAFDADGDDDFRDPQSIRPIDPQRACPFNAADRCEGPDFYNTPAVLPGMDYLEPHLAKDTKGTYSFDVKLPDVECDNCTLQLIQVMEDTIHGAYNVSGNDPNDPEPIADVYYQCIDLVLKRTAVDPGDPGDPDDGCSVSGRPGTTGAGVAALLGLAAVGIRARRRRSR